jgi:hypothetical protein
MVVLLRPAGGRSVAERASSHHHFGSPPTLARAVQSAVVVAFASGGRQPEDLRHGRRGAGDRRRSNGARRDAITRGTEYGLGDCHVLQVKMPKRPLDLCISAPTSREPRGWVLLDVTLRRLREIADAPPNGATVPARKPRPDLDNDADLEVDGPFLCCPNDVTMQGECRDIQRKHGHGRTHL